MMSLHYVVCNYNVTLCCMYDVTPLTNVNSNPDAIRYLLLHSTLYDISYAQRLCLFLDNQVKSSSARQSKITKGPVLACLGGKGLTSMLPIIEVKD